MATTYYKGYEGAVKFNSAGGAAATVTRVTSWNISIKKEILETTAVGDTYTKRVGGIISGSGSLELLYTGENNSLIESINATDDTGLALFELYLSSADTKKISFNGIIDSADYGASTDDVQKISCTFVTTGSITMDV